MIDSTAGQRFGFQGWETRRLWSLWDMLKVDGSAFYKIVVFCTRVETINEQLEKDDAKRGELDAALSRNDRNALSSTMKEIRRELVVLGLPLSIMTVDQLIPRLRSKKCIYRDLGESIRSLRGRIQDELTHVSLFVIDQRLAAFYAPSSPHFGRDVADKFLSSNYDIEEAGKCFAVRRCTACVTHLMRALEPAINSLAAVFNVSTDRANWQNILDQIEAEIKKIGNGPHKPPDWQANKQFYSEAASHLRLIKDAWRNHAMHLRDKYDEERAEAVFVNVRTVMKHLATRLSELPP